MVSDTFFATWRRGRKWCQTPFPGEKVSDTIFQQRSRPCLAAAAHDVLVAGQLLGADRAARVDPARCDADLGAHAELAAVRELRGRVVQQDRAVELAQETLGGG